MLMKMSSSYQVDEKKKKHGIISWITPSKLSTKFPLITKPEFYSNCWRYQWKLLIARNFQTFSWTLQKFTLLKTNLLVSNYVFTQCSVKSSLNIRICKNKKKKKKKKQKKKTGTKDKEKMAEITGENAIKRHRKSTLFPLAKPQFASFPFLFFIVNNAFNITAISSLLLFLKLLFLLLFCKVKIKVH